MGLPPGARLGPYDVLTPLGAGGMGEVYRARDSRLGRDVAIKVVAGEGAQDASRRARFEQEARAAAALNHPNILAVHDVGMADIDGTATPYVVSELLEGESLRARIARGKVPARTAIEIAVQIAKGLAAAHEHGIVHRDIKPENVFLTKAGTVKVLDFGLAKLREQPTVDGTGSTTLGGAPMGTGPGVVLGTVGYMAPEQVRGETVDHRADLFALGCVLYELVSGQRAFQAPTSVETLSAILNTEPPDLTARVTDVPSGLERIVRRCLAKDAAQRFQSARDLAFALEALGETRSSSAGVVSVASAFPAGVWRERIAWSVATLASAAALVVWLTTGRGLMPTPPVAPVMRFIVTPFEETVPGSAARPASGGGSVPRVSPDGRTIVFRAFTEGIGKLHAWSTNAGSASELRGTEGAFAASWSRDGRHLFFRVGTELKRTSLEPGATPAAIPVDGLAVGGNVSVSSNSNGQLLIVDGRQRLLLADATSPIAREVDLRLPEASGVAYADFLPDGRRSLLTTLPPERSSLYVATLGSTEVQLVQAGIGGRVAFVEPDILLYRRQAVLLAQRLDRGSAAIRGEAATVAQSVPPNAWSATVHAVTFAPVTTSLRQLVWRDRIGTTRRIGAPSRTATFDLSNDGRSIAVSQEDELGQSLWVVDAESGEFARMTTGGTQQEADPRWSEDGRRILFGSARAPGRSPHLLTLGQSTMTQLFSFEGPLFSLDDWSRDGRWMVYHNANVPELFARAVVPDAEPIVVARSVTGVIDQAQVSPDSSVVAFNASDTGRFEVYVSPLRGGGERFRVSPDGGVQPTWRADGRELYYVRLDGTLMSVAVTPGTTPAFGRPVPLFRIGSDGMANPTIETYLPAPDGQRFLVLEPASDARPTSFNVIVNWQQLLTPTGEVR